MRFNTLVNIIVCFFVGFALLEIQYVLRSKRYFGGRVELKTSTFIMHSLIAFLFVLGCLYLDFISVYMFFKPSKEVILCVMIFCQFFLQFNYWVVIYIFWNFSKPKLILNKAKYVTSPDISELTRERLKSSDESSTREDSFVL